MAISKRKKKDIIEHGLTHLLLILYTLFTIIPVWWVLVTSLDKKAVGISATKILLFPEKFSLINYHAILKHPDFVTWFRNSFTIAVSTTLFALLIATLAAYAYSRFNFPGKKSGMMFFLIVMMLPTTTAMIPQYLLMLKLGLLGKQTGLILVYTAGQMTFCIWNLKGYFDTIPLSLEEAAIVDGANKLQIFTKIMLPLSTPAIAVTGLMVFTAAWTEFATAYLFVSSKKAFTLAMGIYNWAANPLNIQYPVFCAGALLVALPITILYMIFQRYLISGLTAGGVKG